MLVPSQSVFTYSSKIILLGSNYDQTDIWRIAITELLVPIVVSFVAAAHEGVFISKTADPRIAEEEFDVFVPLSERSVRWVEDLGFLAIFKDTSFDPK